MDLSSESKQGERIGKKEKRHGRSRSRKTKTWEKNAVESSDPPADSYTIKHTAKKGRMAVHGPGNASLNQEMPKTTQTY